MRILLPHGAEVSCPQTIVCQKVVATSDREMRLLQGDTPSSLQDMPGPASGVHI